MASNNPPNQPSGALSPEDLAQFDSLSVAPSSQPQNAPANSHNNYGSYLVGAPDTASAFASKNPQAPKNPYNPFLQQKPQQAAQEPSTLASLQEAEAPQQQQQQHNPFVSDQASRDAPSAGLPSAPALSQQQSDNVPSVAPTAASAIGSNSHPSANQQQQQAPAMQGGELKSWATKDIIFRGQERKIIMQNENGPCSLLAIANILLLRGDVSLSPPDRPLVTYDYLSSLIAEYLLTQPQSQAEGALDKALALLPQTQHGLNLNPSFLSNDAFLDSSATSDASAKQLALFDLLGIKLYHGFVPDSSAPAEYELARMAGSYDAAVDQVVRGEEVTAKFFKEALGEDSVSAALKQLKKRGGFAIVESSGWGTELQRRTIDQALSLSEFLDSNSSQLTYPGLFALSALPQGALVALFRFNHLSVLYRPSDADFPAQAAGEQTGAAAQSSSAPPSLLTLITDDAFLDDEVAIWETLADVDGRDSGDIYDSRLRKRPAGSFAGPRNGIHQEGQSAGGGEDADYALALQLYGEERDRAERQSRRRAERDHQNRQQAQRDAPRHPYRYRPTSRPEEEEVGGAERSPNGNKSGLKGLLSSVFGKKNKDKKHATNGSSGGMPAANTTAYGAGAGAAYVPSGGYSGHGHGHGHGHDGGGASGGFGHGGGHGGDGGASGGGGGGGGDGGGGGGGGT
ncbi:unnamed protein product [Sympodiomycopsis kandeliae]